MKKKLIIILTSIALLFGITTYAIYNQEPTIVLANSDPIELEYGENYSYTQNDLINKSDYKEREYKKLQEGLKISDNFKLEKGKDYLAIGEYCINVQYNEQKLTRKIIVKDTTKPVIKKIKDIEVEENTKKVKYEDCIKVSDLSDTEITYDKSNVNLTKPGKYTVTVTATDMSNNKSTAKIKVTVKKKKEVAHDQANNQNTQSNYVAPTYTPTNGNGKVICIDAGHQARGNSSKEPIGPGAKQTKAKVTTGASGCVTGRLESQVNLEVALKLQSILQSRGYSVVMCRTSQNVNISNAERAQIANKVNAAAFIRIHCDSINNSGVNGISTLAPSTGNPYCANIASKSQRLAKCVLNQTCAQTGAKKRNVIISDTMSGLNWSKVPVTIIEMGFMSNPREDRLLSNGDYQNKLAKGIANGIDQFLK